ncbi:kinase-like protein [Lentinus brumalis]|uniref:Kinase-like protein n=1 Tax=Lentinus brumalis TaxID=2498619 RepID=A0A371D0T2_9APHY|nr:kinase-like protein [Polyporus brumalis]
MATVSAQMESCSQSEVGYSIFDPPQDAIDQVLPLLVHERQLKVLGHAMFASNLFYDLGDGRIVKTGMNTSVEEAKAMVFVRKHTSIPVPEVYMVFQHGGATHIVMELIDGVALREAAELEPDGMTSSGHGLVTDQDLASIMQQLRDYIRELRELGRRHPPSQPHFGSWPDGPFRNSYFASAPPETAFESVDAFHAYFLDRLRPLSREKATYDQLVIARSQSQESEPVLTHGDLAPRNILVKNGCIVGVVDWETFGWYPGFWEYMGIGNEGSSDRVYQAIEDVFGMTSFVCETYQFVHACLTLPYY